MKKIEIFDPAMCCSTGACGPGVNPELLRVATVLDALTKQGANVTRYNLASETQAFVTNATISNLLRQDQEVLPVTLVDGEVVKTKGYLTNEELTEITGIDITQIAMPTEEEESCCGGESCCC